VLIFFVLFVSFVVKTHVFSIHLPTISEESGRMRPLEKMMAAVLER
jgi:hypothetical protein